MRTVVKFEIQGRIAWKVLRGQSGAWVGICDALGLTVEGETWGKMTEAGNEAIELLLSDLMETGDMDAFMTKHGWRPVMPLPVQIDGPQDLAFDVPMFFEPADGTSCHA